MPYSNPEQRRLYCRTRYANDSVYRAKALQRSRRRNSEMANAYRRMWRQRPDVQLRIVLANRIYREAHRAYFAAHESARRALKYTTQTEPIDYARVIALASGFCGICRMALDTKTEIDHIIPLSRGGSHTYDNLQAAHQSCNRRKHVKLEHELGVR